MQGFLPGSVPCTASLAPLWALGDPEGSALASRSPQTAGQRLQGLGWDPKLREGLRSEEALGKRKRGCEGKPGGAATTTSRLPLPHWPLSGPGWTQWDLVVGDKVGLYPGPPLGEADVSQREEAVRRSSLEGPQRRLTKEKSAVKYLFPPAVRQGLG